MAVLIASRYVATAAANASLPGEFGVVKEFVPSPREYTAAPR